ncbi:MAG: hypothetical protein QXO76_06125 [Thermoproteota archaeon]
MNTYADNRMKRGFSVTILFFLIASIPIYLCVALQDCDSDWEPKAAGYAIIYAGVCGLYNQLGDSYYYSTYHRVSFGDCIDTHWSFQGFIYVGSYRQEVYVLSGGSFFGYYSVQRTFSIQATEAMSYSSAYAWPWGGMDAIAWIGPPGIV